MMYTTSHSIARAKGAMSGDTTQNQLQSTVFVSLSTRKTRKIGKKAPKLTVIEGFALSGIYI